MSDNSSGPAPGQGVANADASGPPPGAKAGDPDLGVHLQMIQAVVARMGQNAFNAKTWAVTVMAALLAFAPTDDSSRAGLWLVAAPAIGFWWLDAYFLRMERAFRVMYEAAAVRGEVARFALDPKMYLKAEPSRLFAAGVWPIHAGTLLAVYVKAAWSAGNLKAVAAALCGWAQH